MPSSRSVEVVSSNWCSRIIRKITQGKEDGLVSYGQPGVGPNAWNITSEQLDELLKKHHLISRPTFVGHGAVYHLKTAEEMLALADRAIAAQGMEYLVIHGVERLTPRWGYQDMWPLKQDVFFALLDGLKERREKGKLWITDHISMHQYESERNSAEVRVLETNDRAIRLELKCKADPRYYDFPLTLVARVPADWQRARARDARRQGDRGRGRKRSDPLRRAAQRYTDQRGGGKKTVICTLPRLVSIATAYSTAYFEVYPDPSRRSQNAQTSKT